MIENEKSLDKKPIGKSKRQTSRSRNAHNPFEGSIGTNVFKTHPKAKRLGYRYDEMHSELDALLKAPQRKNLHLYNFRFNRFGEMRISRPCKLCMPWCIAIFDKIYFTTPEGVERIK